MQRSPVSAAELDLRQRRALARYRSWQRFARGPRRNSRPLLGSLGRYPDAVLVAGCQRSGTTMLTRVIAGSAGFRGLALTSDDELDAALALCGEIDLPVGDRYCFQTTYLNERYPAYRNLGPAHRLIWVVRNPRSVVYSMVHNWRRFALDELYEGCGVKQVDASAARDAARWWPFGPSAIEKACRAYAGKAGQLEAIAAMVGPDRLLVVDYDQLVRAPAAPLADIFRFIGADPDSACTAQIRADSLGKADRLSARAIALIERWAAPVHRRSLSFVSRSPAP